MPKVVKIRRWEKKTDRMKGKKLQIIANRMLMLGETGPSYLKIRRAAEYHLGFWDQKDTGVSDYPKACKAVNCPHLPAGSEACRDPEHLCP